MPIGDLFDGCYSDEHRRLGTPEKFQETFCKRCRNPECRRSTIHRSTWVDRISTQEERLLIHPRFEDPENPKFRDVVAKDFMDKLQEALALEVSSKRGDWEIPTTEDVIEHAVKQAMAQPTPPKEEEKVLWEGVAKGSLNRTYQIKLTSEGWSCTCPAFTHGTVGPLGCKHIVEARASYEASDSPKEPEVPPTRGPVQTGQRVLSVPKAGNTRFPSEGVMLGGAATDTPSTPEVDPWAPPTQPVLRGTVVPVHAKVVMGSKKP